MYQAVDLSSRSHLCIRLFLWSLFIETQWMGTQYGRQLVSVCYPVSRIVVDGNWLTLNCEYCSEGLSSYLAIKISYISQWNTAIGWSISLHKCWSADPGLWIPKISLLIPAEFFGPAFFATEFVSSADQTLFLDQLICSLNSYLISADESLYTILFYISCFGPSVPQFYWLIPLYFLRSADFVLNK
jgi:hypothetical protein